MVLYNSGSYYIKDTVDIVDSDLACPILSLLTNDNS